MRVAVDQYEPTDFSFGAKAKQLFGLEFLVTSVAVALAVLAITRVGLYWVSLFPIAGLLLASTDFPHLIDIPTPIPSLIALVPSTIVFLLYLPRRNELLPVAVSLAAMTAAIVLPTALWLANGLSLQVATIGTVILLLATVFILRWYFVKQFLAREATTTHGDAGN